MAITMQDLDIEFLNRAERRTAFDISSSDFNSMKYKNEIRYLFNRYFFPKFDLSKTIKGIDMNKINSLIAQLKSEDRQRFFDLYDYKNIKGIGPGEVMLYFLIDDAYLGGGSSAGADIMFIGGATYEVKAANISSNKEAMDFKLGGTVNLSQVMSELDKLRTRLNLGGSASEISTGKIEQMRKMAPTEFKKIEDKFATIAYSYFGNHDIIFLRNNRSGSGFASNSGVIEAIKRVKKEDISIHAMTSGTIKPKVKL
jgi:hypothetical protein